MWRSEYRDRSIVPASSSKRREVRAMPAKIWRDQEMNPYAILSQGRIFRVVKDSRRQPVDKLMRRVDFSQGIGVLRKSENAQPQHEEPSSRKRMIALSDESTARSTFWSGPFLFARSRDRLLGSMFA